MILGPRQVQHRPLSEHLRTIPEEPRLDTKEHHLRSVDKQLHVGTPGIPRPPLRRQRLPGTVRIRRPLLPRLADTVPHGLRHPRARHPPGHGRAVEGDAP